ncbi:hypothetical protein CRENBAI_023413, partial [Crenichthys baileyi]
MSGWHLLSSSGGSGRHIHPTSVVSELVPGFRVPRQAPPHRPSLSFPKPRILHCSPELL